jgi:DNA topoisomerase-1
LLAFKELGEPTNKTAAKKNIIIALDKVAEQLGNTRTVCKKYYVHPIIIVLYEKQSLGNYFKQTDIDKNKDSTNLAVEEKIMMKILEKA